MNNFIPIILEKMLDKLIFDYLIKKGFYPTRNAITLLKYIGYPQGIVENAEKRILNCD